MHAILFSAQFYYRMESDPVIDEHLQKLITLYASSNSLFSAANINVALMNLMLYILDHTEAEHGFSEPQLQNSYVAYTLNYIREHFTQKIRPDQPFHRVNAEYKSNADRNRSAGRIQRFPALF